MDLLVDFVMSGRTDGDYVTPLIRCTLCDRVVIDDLGGTSLGELDAATRHARHEHRLECPRPGGA